MSNDLWREFENRFAEVQREGDVLKMRELFREYRSKGLNIEGVEMAWFTSPLTPLQGRGEKKQSD